LDSLSSSPLPSSPTPPTEPAVVALARVLVTGGGAVYLAHAGTIPAWGVLVVLGCIAVPAQAGAIIDVIRGRR